jgi:hypothetical protein
MTTEIHKRASGTTIAFGAIGGFVSAVVMAPLLMITAIIAGMPSSVIPIAIRIMFGASTGENALMLGFGVHLAAGTIIGIIFGAITGHLKKLSITGYGKGIAEGIIAGIISFVALFLPVSMAAMPPVLINIMLQMNPGLSQQQLMVMMQQAAPALMGMSILSHLIYGVVLGGITSVLVLRRTAGRRGI